jgi:hypothetical protein
LDTRSWVNAHANAQIGVEVLVRGLGSSRDEAMEPEELIAFEGLGVRREGALACELEGALGPIWLSSIHDGS